jgi:hypothetical protein
MQQLPGGKTDSSSENSKIKKALLLFVIAFLYRSERSQLRRFFLTKTFIIGLKI